MDLPFNCPLGGVGGRCYEMYLCKVSLSRLLNVVWVANGNNGAQGIIVIHLKSVLQPPPPKIWVTLTLIKALWYVMAQDFCAKSDFVCSFVNRRGLVNRKKIGVEFFRNFFWGGPSGGDPLNLSRLLDMLAIFLTINMPVLPCGPFQRLPGSGNTNQWANIITSIHLITSYGENSLNKFQCKRHF